jgi:ribonucleoside-diphosphate reductase alpha chain
MLMLDNVIDLNHYPIPEARASNLRHRPVGLGLMGFQDALWELGIGYASEAAVAFADSSMEAISYYAILASTDLAKERGAYPSFPARSGTAGCCRSTRGAAGRGPGRNGRGSISGRRWTGSRSVPRPRPRDAQLQHDGDRADGDDRQHPGRRPVDRTALHQPLRKSNLSGEFTVVNDRLVRDLDARGLWDAEMLDDLKYEDGSVQKIERVPDELKARYPTAFEVDPSWLVGLRRPPPEVDRHGPVAQPLRRGTLRPPPERPLPRRLAAGAEDDLLPALPRRHPGRKIDPRRQSPGFQPRWMRARSASADLALARPAEHAADEDDPMDVACEACQ